MDWERSPQRQWILQERSELVEKMGEKRRRKMKGGRDAADTAAATLEVDKKLSNRYEGSVGSRTTSCYPSGGRLGRIRTEGTGGASTASEAASLSFDLRTV